MSTEEVPLNEKNKQAPKKKPRIPHSSGKIFPSEVDLRDMKKYTSKLIKQLGIKVGTRSWKV